MARLILGGYSSDVVIQLHDGVARALHLAIFDRLKSGKGMSLRCGRTVDDEIVVSNLWISPSSAIRFDFGSDVEPAFSEDMVKSFVSDIKRYGGMALPTDAEFERRRAEQGGTHGGCGSAQDSRETQWEFSVRKPLGGQEDNVELPRRQHLHPNYRVISASVMEEGLPAGHWRNGSAAGLPQLRVVASRRKERRVQRIRDIPVAGAVEVLWSKYRWFCGEPACDRLSFFESTAQVRAVPGPPAGSGTTLLTRSSGLAGQCPRRRPRSRCPDGRSVRYFRDPDSSSWIRHEPWMTTIVDRDTG